MSFSVDLSLCVGRKQQLKTELSGHVDYTKMMPKAARKE